jgi:hypothetical protein
VNDDLSGIETRLRWDRLARVLGRAREGEGLWEVERRALSDFGDLVRVDLLCRKQAVRRWDSDTPQGMEMLTPRRVAFAAAEAFAEGLLGSVQGD